MAKVSKNTHLKKIYIPGIMGLARFLQGFYLVIVTAAEVVGDIGGNPFPQFRAQNLPSLKDGDHPVIHPFQRHHLEGLDEAQIALRYVQL